MPEDPLQTTPLRPKPQKLGMLRLYVPPEDRELIEAAREALHRDNSSLSAFFRQNLRAWWEKHKPGNPQTTIGRYAQAEQPKPEKRPETASLTDDF